MFYNPCLHSIFLSDMAGFAFSVDLLVSRGGNASMPYWVGHEEDEFIKSLGVEYQDLEPRFGNKSNSVFAFFCWKEVSFIFREEFSCTSIDPLVTSHPAVLEADWTLKSPRLKFFWNFREVVECRNPLIVKKGDLKKELF